MNQIVDNQSFVEFDRSKYITPSYLSIKYAQSNMPKPERTSWDKEVQ